MVGVVTANKLGLYLWNSYFGKVMVSTTGRLSQSKEAESLS